MQAIKDAIKSSFSFALFGSGALGAWLRIRPSRDRIVILNYHDIAPRLFEDHLRHILATYRVITLDEAVGCIRGETPPRTNAVAITFDDAYAGFVDELYPILSRLRVPVTMFVPTGSVDLQTVLWFNQVKAAVLGSGGDVLHLGNRSFRLDRDRRGAYWRVVTALNAMDREQRDACLNELLRSATPDRACLDRHRPMTWDQMRRMGDRVSFGAHSVTHPNLAVLDSERLEFEVGESKRRIESELDRPVRHFAYPFGRPQQVGGSVAAVVGRSGFACGLTTVRGTCGSGDDLLRLPRIVCDGIGGGRILAARLSDLWICLST